MSPVRTAPAALTAAPAVARGDAAPSPGRALYLSGGGYRAMLFHVGALWRLNEFGYLRRLDHVSSVSGGSITAAQFLQRFIRKGTPWAHLDIAGVALPPAETALAPKGATGWGVMTLDRLVRDRFESR